MVTGVYVTVDFRAKVLLICDFPDMQLPDNSHVNLLYQHHLMYTLKLFLNIIKVTIKN